MPKQPDRIGQLIAQRYELVEIVGRGGQGMVYRALDRWSGREVAVKVMGSKAAREPEMVQRLMREQQALIVLKGTSAVELFDVCRGNDGELCLVMELLRGMDLDDHLYSLGERRRRLSFDRIGEIFDPIVNTLETAHAAGILHRDLKPANIFLLEGGGVRLLDFGMARLKNAAPLTAAGTVMGSPSFMAPEAWKGLSDLLDARADVYSLGVILFLVLTGELPFDGATLHEKFTMATTGKRPSLRKLRPDLPRAADDWGALALALDREQRFASVRALWNAFVSTFHVKVPSRDNASIWAKARGAVQRIAGSQPPPAALPGPPVAHEKSDYPSFTREALARTVLRSDSPTADSEDGLTIKSRPPEKTLEIDEGELVDVEPKRRAAPPPPPPAPRTPEKTLSISAEIILDAPSGPNANSDKG